MKSRTHIWVEVKRKYHHFRRLVLAALGRDHALRPEVRLKTVRLGRDLYDWVIVPALLRKDSIVYSVGLGDDVSFDLELIDLIGCRVYGFEPSPMALDILARRELPPLLAIQPYGWATFDGEQVFGAQGGSDYAVCVYTKTDDPITCQVRCPRTVMKSLGHDRLDLLKMDIEGSEFGVIRQMLNVNIFPGQLLVEFHHRWDCSTLHDMLQLVAELQRVGYVIFFVSETGNELSFLRNDLIGRVG